MEEKGPTFIGFGFFALSLSVKRNKTGGNMLMEKNNELVKKTIQNM